MSVEIIVALDVPSSADALALVNRLGDSCDFYKVGLELFSASGPSIVEELRSLEKRVFLDLKLHDIPNTVEGAARSAARLGVSIMTVHLSGGRKMLEGAVRGAGASSSVFGVSVLTSFSAPSLAESWGREATLDTGVEVMRLARLARECGLAGIVCSAHEVEGVRRECGSGMGILVPGLRLAGDDAGDQARVATPEVAARLGASHLVLGRAVTRSEDPAGTVRRVRESLGP